MLSLALPIISWDFLFSPPGGEEPFIGRRHEFRDYVLGAFAGTPPSVGVIFGRGERDNSDGGDRAKCLPKYQGRPAAMRSQRHDVDAGRVEITFFQIGSDGLGAVEGAVTPDFGSGNSDQGVGISPDRSHDLRRKVGVRMVARGMMSFPEGAAAGDYPLVTLGSKLVDGCIEGIFGKPTFDHERICSDPVRRGQEGVGELEGRCHHEGR